MEPLQSDHRDYGAGEAAQRKPPHDHPVSAPVRVVNSSADGLRDPGKQQIGPDSRGRRHTEEQDQNRRHERAAANAGYPDQ